MRPPRVERLHDRARGRFVRVEVADHSSSGAPDDALRFMRPSRYYDDLPTLAQHLETDTQESGCPFVLDQASVDREEVPCDVADDTFGDEPAPDVILKLIHHRGIADLAVGHAPDSDERVVDATPQPRRHLDYAVGKQSFLCLR